MSLDAAYVTVAQVRARELKTRLAAGVIIAAVAWAVAPNPWIFVWLAALFLVQIPDQKIGAAIRAHEGRLPPWLKQAAVGCAALSAAVYASVGIILWLQGGEAGRILSMMLLAGGLLHVSLHMHHARPVMLGTLAPYLVGWVGLPLLSTFTPSGYSPAVTAGMLAAGALYLLHLYNAVGAAHATTEELREATLAAEGREASVRLLIEDNPVAVLLVDPLDLQILDANAAACRQYGWPRETLLTFNTLDLAAPDEREAARNLHEAGDFRTSSGQRTWRMRRQDGTEIFVKPYSQFVWTEGRRLALSAMVDVTERHRAEQALIENAQALERARDEADAANSAKSVFLIDIFSLVSRAFDGPLRLLLYDIIIIASRAPMTARPG